MGQAKQRRERERRDILAMMDNWRQPPTPAEAQLAVAIAALPSVRVMRESPGRLAWAGMRERLCHDNCAWYAANDPNGGSTACVGWMHDELGNYVLHSVIVTQGAYVCITPMPYRAGTAFEFSPDPDIVVTRTPAEGYAFHRHGEPVLPSVRRDSEATLALIERVHGRIAAGMDAMDAVALG